MGRSPVPVGLAILALTLGAGSSLAAGEMGELLVNEDRLHQGQPNVVHVSLETPRDERPVNVRVAIEGIDGARTVEHSRTVPAGGSELVTVTWTPKRAGPYTIEAHTSVGGDLLDVDVRSVEVAPSPARAGDEGELLPHTAPGTVQWAIAFGVLFFVARAGLGHRS